MSDNPERDWTEQEKEEFFASQDALTGILNGVPNQPPIEWSTGWWNGAIHPLSSEDPFGDLEHFIHPGIHVTSIVPPEQGWPIVAHCDMCKKTVIVLSPWAIKPEKGDYWKMEGTCLDEEKHIRHNMYPEKFAPYPWPLTPILGDVK
jgi:hypothetical protein